MISSDIFALFVVLVILALVVFVVVTTSKAMSDTLEATKENLKAKGLHVSSTGIAIKTEKQFGHEAYLDATQRGVVRALNASSVQKADKQSQHKRSTSAHHGDSEKRLPSLFMKRSHSNQDEHDKKHRGLFWKGKNSDKVAS